MSSSSLLSRRGPGTNAPLPKSNDIPNLDSAAFSTSLNAAAQDDDSDMWEEYLKAASEADNRLISDWSTIIDSVLIYATLLIGVIATFVVDTSTQFQRDPAAISNDLLVAIYKRLADPTSPLVNTDDLFKLDPADYKKVVQQNFLLYLSLGVAILVTGVAAASKIWILRFGRAINSPGTSFERAMARQKAYSGMRAWKLEAFVESLNILMLVSVYLFGLFNYSVLLDANLALALAFAASLALGFVLVMFPSIVAAFIPTAPFHSVFSASIELLFRVFPHVGIPLGRRRRTLDLRTIAIFIISLMCFGAAGFLVVQLSLNFILILVFPIAGVFAVSGGIIEDEDIKPRLFNLPLLLLVGSAIVAPTLGLTLYFATQRSPFYILFFSFTTVDIIVGGYIAIKQSATVPKTTEAEAITWMITSSATQDTRWYQKAANLTEKSPNLRSLLFNQLLPALKRLITSSRGAAGSHPDPSVTPEQESLIRNLARLADFEDTKPEILRNFAPFTHGRIPRDDPLRGKLRWIAERGSCPKANDPSNCHCVRCSAVLLLKKFGEDEG